MEEYASHGDSRTRGMQAKGKTVHILDLFFIEKVEDRPMHEVNSGVNETVAKTSSFILRTEAAADLIFTTDLRRLSEQNTRLGSKYMDLTQKYLECDFGYGKDLHKPQLQKAIYDKLVCELEIMIVSLDIRDEGEYE
ncbi:hypothetical protein B0J13DRAFT_628136 [Dactylonectria estremocensis]|uniref:Uncharacterized protein n=1 Tax=Dactylonectria estremocensis TaxID=1079267 RepID=A0A9P9DT62_9HYPO|nr:hypothetical protein B0J13DRAFT_628136 [Dactylonectria estremocensis]